MLQRVYKCQKDRPYQLRVLQYKEVKVKLIYFCEKLEIELSDATENMCS